MNPCTKKFQYVQEQWIMIDTFKEKGKMPPPLKANVTMENPPFEDVFPYRKFWWFSKVMLVFRGVHIPASVLAIYLCMLGMASFNRAKQNREIAEAADKMASAVAPRLKYFSLGFTSEIGSLGFSLRQCIELHAG